MQAPGPAGSAHPPNRSGCGSRTRPSHTQAAGPTWHIPQNIAGHRLHIVMYQALKGSLSNMIWHIGNTCRFGVLGPGFCQKQKTLSICSELLKSG